MFAELIALHVPLLAPSAATEPDLELERLRQVVRAVGVEATEREGVPGIAIAVLRGDELVAECALGSGGTAIGDAVTPATRFDVGSLTRQFTAVAILELAGESRLALDDELVVHVPSFPTAGGSPTIRQILQSRSGVPGWAAILERHPGAATQAFDDAGFLALFADVPFAFVPGASVSQDSLGFLLLALVVERAGGSSYAEWIQRRVVEPAGLAATRFCPEGSTAGHAEDCRRGEGAVEISLPAAPTRIARTLCSTARDVARWQRALHSGLALDEAARNLFLAPSGSKTGPDELGCAVATSRLEGQLRHLHVGGARQQRVAAAYYPASELAIAVLANCSTAEVERIEDEIARVAHGLPPARGEFPLFASEERRLPGMYQLATTQIRVRLDEGHLWFEEPGQGAVHLRSRGRGEFLLEGEPDARVVFDLEAPHAAWFLLVRGGATSRAIRLE